MAQLEVSDIIKKVQRVQIVANRTVNELFAGQYKSVFRGQGMEFDEVREYQPGDDIRSIDWNVTARAGMPFIKRFVEERELTVLFAVDVSASGAFGSCDRSKLDMVIETAATLMFSALKNNDKVGLVTFCDEVGRYVKPRKGKSHVLHLIRELVAVQPVSGETNLESVLQFISRVQKRKAVVFLISDFLAPEARHALAVCGKRHDLIAMSVSDPRESALPDVGFVSLMDAETGEIVEVDTSHPEVRRLFALKAAERSGAISNRLRKAGVDELPLQTNEDCMTGVRRFFRMRERRFR